MKFQMGDWVTTQGWKEYLQVADMNFDGSKILIKEDDSEEWYSCEGFTKKGNEMQDSNKVKPDEFRVGDKVWCLIYGKGYVTYIEIEAATYPIAVVFDGLGSAWYTLDGRYSEECNRTLFFSEPKIEASVTRQFVPTLVGKTVMAQYYDETWTVKPITITKETPDEIFTKEGSDCKSDLIAVYEVSSENLLKKD